MRLPDPQRSQVVLIGTSSYADSRLPDLPVVGKSISDLTATFIEPVYGLVPEDHCTVLADEGDIRLIGRQLRQAARQAEDLLLVYYAGHGLVGARRHDLYLALPDSEWVEPEFNSLEYDKLRSAVLDSPAKTKVIILDCCFSGRVVSDTMADPLSAVIEQVEVEGTYVLTSAQRDQVALVLPGEEHTAFTGRLLNLLRDGIPGGSELLTIDDLYRQLVSRMQAEGLPHPQRRGTDSADLLALARNRAYDHQPATGELPIVTLEDAMTELEQMIGLNQVKQQIRSMVVSIEAARRRAVAGLYKGKPMRHFVFLGSPGMGKASIAGIITKIFYAFGLLDSPTPVKVHPVDLVRERPGASAEQTNMLIDSALGRVLYIEDADSLINQDGGQGERFAFEALQVLLKRAEDNRDDLIIILAGREKKMEFFLASEPMLTSNFTTVMNFPGYTPTDLLSLAESLLQRDGECLDIGGRDVLKDLLEDMARRELIDELGNSRFIHRLLKEAGQARDVRVLTSGEPQHTDLVTASGEPQHTDLVTVCAEDVRLGFGELISRMHGYRHLRLAEGVRGYADTLASPAAKNFEGSFPERPPEVTGQSVTDTSSSAGGLLAADDTVVVAARDAWPEYQRLTAYICQPNRPFRTGLKYFGFYAEGVIQPLIPRIREHHTAVPFTRDEASARRASGEDELASLIDHLLDEGSRTEGEAYDVLLLTSTDDPKTVRLPAPIANDTITQSGKPWGWTLKQRYTRLDKLTSGVTRTSQL
jgi:Caspase domain/ATPase family associated with various cellular activities (AAA)/AAA lid domain